MTPDSLRDENRYLERVFHKNNYNADFIRRNIYQTYWSWRNEQERNACYYSDYTLH